MNSKYTELEQIYRDVHSCKKCHEFSDGFIQYDSEKVKRKAFHSALQSKTFIVAQSLAKDQVRLSGVPYHDSNMRMSRGGKYLDRYFNAIGYTLSPWDNINKYVYTTDLVQCFPGRKKSGYGDNIPVKKEINNCIPWFLKELTLIEPEVILLLGTASTKAFYKHVLEKVVNTIEPLYLKRHIYDAPFGGISVFVLPHSSSMVKGKSDIYNNTFQMVKEELSH